MLPLLLPALRRVWRDAETLQLGLDPRRAVVVGGLTPPVGALLAHLDGGGPAHVALERAAPDPADRVAASRLLTLLDAAGCLTDGPPEAVPAALAPDAAALSLTAVRGRPEPRMARRAAAQVRVRGAGRVGGPLASLLGAAGVGRVVVEDAGATRPIDLAPGGLLTRDLRRPRAAALSRRLPRPAPRAGRRADDLVVIAMPGPGDPDPAPARALLLAGTPHLSVGVRENTGWVGPLVLPGDGPCLGCLEHHRTDRDPAWPLIAAQLGEPSPRVVDPCAISLALTVAGIAATQVLTLLDGDGPDLPATVASGAHGGILELTYPDWRVRRRGFAVHPACDCRRAAGAARTAPKAPAPATMTT